MPFIFFGFNLSILKRKPSRWTTQILPFPPNTHTHTHQTPSSSSCRDRRRSVTKGNTSENVHPSRALSCRRRRSKGIDAVKDHLKKMGSLGLDDVAINEVPWSFISRLYSGISNDYPFVEPLPALRTNEPDLVRDVLQMLQVFSGSLFSWDESARCFHFKDSVHVPHLSPASLAHIVDQFVHGVTCLQRAGLFVKKVQTSRARSPTLRTFSYSVSLWLE